MHFKDRTEAGQKLARVLVKKYKGEEVVVYAMPRGGAVLGYEIAAELKAPLGLAITRKVGHPFQPEYAVCAVAEDGDILCDESEKAGVAKSWLAAEIKKERDEARRRRELYLKDQQPISARGKIVILVDDGIATGLTILLAIKEVMHSNPERVVVAVPVAPPDAAEKIRDMADELVVLEVPKFYLGSVGAYYDEFPQVEDSEVIKLLRLININQKPRP